MKIDKDMARRVAFSIIGATFLAIGIGLTVKINIGVSSVECITTGLSKITPIGIGTWTALIQIVFLVIAFIVYKKNLGFSTIAFMLISKYPVDFVTNHFPDVQNYAAKIVVFVIACAILAIGSEFLICSRLGATAYDAMTMSIGKLFKHKVKYVYIRWGCDLTLALVGFLIGGDVGVGTVISVIVIGPFMKMCENLLFKKYKD